MTAMILKKRFQGKKEDKAGNFQVLNKSGDVVYTGVAKECGEVPTGKPVITGQWIFLM